MTNPEYRLSKSLLNKVRNKKLQIDFGTLTENGWFSAAPADLSVNRAIRSNNAGALNITNWQKNRPGYAGYTDADAVGNRTTIYQTPEHGVSAWYHLISKIYGFETSGQFDVGTLARKYAGSSAPESAIQAYIDGWSRWHSGALDADTVIHLNSNEELVEFAKALFAHEAAAVTPLHDDQITTGIELERRTAMTMRHLAMQRERLSVREMLLSAHEENQLELMYESGFEQEVLDFGGRVLAEPSSHTLSEWLYVYSLLSDLSLEGPATITYELLNQHRDLFEAIAKDLDPDVLFAAEDFIAAIESRPLSFGQMEAASRAAETTAVGGELRALTRALPLLATFNITQESTDSRVVRYTGELVVHDANGNIAGSYSATTGGFVASYKRKNGPTPPGYFIVSNYRKRTESWATRQDIGFTFDIDEVVHTGTRSAFRIHPDGAPPGTHGCVGLVEDAARLKDCRDRLRANLAAVGEFRLLVRYGAGDRLLAGDIERAGIHA